MKWFRFHLSTAIVLMLVAGWFIGRNMIGIDQVITLDDSPNNPEERHRQSSGWIHVGDQNHPFRFKCHSTGYGWPFTYRQEIQFRSGIVKVYKDALFYNVLIAILCIVFCGFLLEHLLKRYVDAIVSVSSAGIVRGVVHYFCMPWLAVVATSGMIGFLDAHIVTSSARGRFSVEFASALPAIFSLTVFGRFLDCASLWRSIAVGVILYILSAIFYFLFLGRYGEMIVFFMLNMSCISVPFWICGCFLIRYERKWILTLMNQRVATQGVVPVPTQPVTTKDRDEKDEEKPQQSEELKHR